MGHQQNNRWDIFCKIVDNYGDIGVCWRLSQQLVKEHHLQVRLFIDDLNAAKKIIINLDNALQQQSISGVEICTWPTLELEPATVVIEAFSCTLPDTYIQQMIRYRSIWINLEYLSAEPWVSDYHAKPSPHPTLAITRHFFFPGFKNDTGGLIRENNLIAERNALLSSRANKTEFGRKIGITDEKYFTANDLSDDAVKISLFCYPQANISRLLSDLMGAKQPVNIFFPFNGTEEILNGIFTDFNIVNEKILRKANITIHLLPFLSQSDYDHLLWVCDLNFVRGEDSWIRAIWASKPFIWQPYIQTEHTHIKKLRAFLEVYSNGASNEIKSLLFDAHHSWSNEETSEAMPFQNLIKNLPKLLAHAKQQANLLASQPDLATQLVFFSKNLLKNQV
jgi:uncharacterized repeat protein (TIGR03837 family)